MPPLGFLSFDFFFYIFIFGEPWKVAFRLVEREREKQNLLIDVRKQHNTNLLNLQNKIEIRK